MDLNYRKYVQELCNAVILEVLQNRKTETSNVILISLNALNDDNIQKERIYEELNNMSDNEKKEIINEGVCLLSNLLF